MKLIFLFCLIFGLGESKPQTKIVPTFELKKWASRSAVPLVRVTFPDGYQDNLVLHRHYSTESSRRERKLHCNFVGHLKKESRACVAMTGCIGSEDVHFTIMSKHNVNHFMYVWNQKSGSVRGVESTFKNQNATTRMVELDPGAFGDANVALQDGDTMVDLDQQALDIEAEEACALNGNCDNFPVAQKLQLKVFYTQAFLDQVTNDEIEPWMDATFAHVQVHFCHASLGTSVFIERIGGTEFVPGLTIKADTNGLSAIRASANADTSGADLFSYFTFDPEYYGVIGIAWRPVVCKSYSNQWKTNINEWRATVVENAQVVAHEIGHNIAMYHDFDTTHDDKDSDGNRGTHKAQGCDNENTDGIMNYGAPEEAWSTCSAFDFLNHFRSIGVSSWCMEPMDSFCNPKTRVLVVAGSQYSQSTFTTEVLDLYHDGSPATCSNFAPFPTELSYATGGLLGDTPFICGGFRNRRGSWGGYRGLMKSCWEITSNAVTQSSDLLEYRSYADSIVVEDDQGDDALLVAGGYNSQNNKGMASTEFVKPGATSVSGNPMPGKRMYHCFVKYDDDNAMIVGGHSDAYSYYDRFTTETFVYTISTQTWSSGPATDIGRTYHACGAGVDISTGNKYILATGGYTHPWTMAGVTSSIWIEGQNSFVPSVNVPVDIVKHEIVSSPDGKSLFLLGGKIRTQTNVQGPQPNIFKFELDNGVGTWTQVQQSLSLPRLWFVAMNIPDSIADCTSRKAEAVEVE